MPASVRSNPDASSKRTRSAIGDLPGRSTVAGIASDHRSHPARARWNTRCVPPQSRSMNLPCRDTPSTGAPTSACGGGVKVLSTEIEPSSTPVTTSPDVRSPRNSTRACTSGSSGMRRRYRSSGSGSRYAGGSSNEGTVVEACCASVRLGTSACQKARTWRSSP